MADIDPSKLSEEDQKAFKLYGKLPGKPRLNGGVKYFDSGDYNMKLQGVNSSVGVGIPDPSRIPHSVPKSHARKPSDGKPISSGLAKPGASD